MKEYQSPEAVEMGGASEAILGIKIGDPPDADLGPTYPRFWASVVDIDQ